MKIVPLLQLVEHRQRTTHTTNTTSQCESIGGRLELRQNSQLIINNTQQQWVCLETTDVLSTWFYNVSFKFLLPCIQHVSSRQENKPLVTSQNAIEPQRQSTCPLPLKPLSCLSSSNLVKVKQSISLSRKTILCVLWIKPVSRRFKQLQQTRVEDWVATFPFKAVQIPY